MDSDRDLRQVNCMKMFRNLLAASALAGSVLALSLPVGTAAAAITVQDSGTAPFTALDLGTAGSAGFVSNATITSGPAIGFDGISSIAFSGALTGVYAGASGTAASPFPLGTPGSSLEEYFAAQRSEERRVAKACSTGW